MCNPNILFAKQWLMNPKWFGGAASCKNDSLLSPGTNIFIICEYIYVHMYSQVEYICTGGVHMYSQVECICTGGVHMYSQVEFIYTRGVHMHSQVEYICTDGEHMYSQVEFIWTHRWSTYVQVEYIIMYSQVEFSQPGVRSQRFSSLNIKLMAFTIYRAY